MSQKQTHKCVPAMCPCSGSELGVMAMQGFLYTFQCFRIGTLLDGTSKQRSYHLVTPVGFIKAEERLVIHILIKMEPFHYLLFL